ncbi:flagellar biosynthesis protein FlgL [Sulfurimonas sp.]|uniref:flagellin N-terminal helical domain-containing protein n=1 Tax=Sulfurimonas sp. TaxID=2022749 RepID=UPI002B471A43|nr:flagellar biosynthesis protein FlgL [Sulfurimonas sp.]
MRITSGMYDKNIYETNNSKLSNKLFDVNKQIASGFKIQYAKGDVRIFAETMMLDNELFGLEQIINSTQSGHKISNQTDVILNEFTKTMTRMRTLLVNAANGTHSDASLDAIANELRVIEEHFKNLSNTSINGQYLFSGTAVDIKPISSDGKYHGNNGSLKSFLGSGSQQQYNISGDQLFFGEEVLTKRKITTNVEQSNVSKKYDFATGTDNETISSPLASKDTIRDFMGDTDDNIDSITNKHHFYLRGTTSNGTSFKSKISMKDTDTVDELLSRIGQAYGNTANLKVVNVSLNSSGQIVVEDKIKGSSKLDFHMVGAVDFDTTGADAANITDIDDLDSGEASFKNIMNTLSTGGIPGLYVKEFIKSGFTSASTGSNPAATNIEGLLHDRTQFSKDGSRLSSNVSQILKDTNAFASDSTKLHEVFSGITYNTDGTYASGLDGKVLKLTGVDINGSNYDVDINLSDAGSTFSVGGNTYDIFNVASVRTGTPAGDLTYKQLMDVVNMVVTNTLPTASPAGTAAQYDAAVKDANAKGGTFLSSDGKINFKELGSTSTEAKLSLYDSNSDDFSGAASVGSFNSNNALTIRDPKTDFFKQLNKMITAVEDHKVYPDASDGSPRNAGIENALTMIDDLQNHISRSHAMVGSQSNALKSSLGRTKLIKISTQTLRSQVLDTDAAEAALTLKKLTINYEAMLLTVGKVSKLSLVNYL